MLEHIFIHMTTPVKILVMALAVTKFIDIVIYFVKRHKQNKK